MSEQKRIRRNPLNYYVPKSGQFVYGLALGLLSTAFLLGTWAAFLAATFSPESSNCFTDPASREMLKTAIIRSLPLLLGGGLVTYSVAFALGIVLTHRTFGPTVPINRHLDSLLEGNYTSRIILRRRDHFHEMAQKLNTLAEKLEGDAPKPKKEKKEKEKDKEKKDA